MIRLIDFFLAAIGLLISSPLLIILFILVYKESGSPFFFQTRLGYKKTQFIIIKFRTMNLNAPNIPTHLINFSVITPLGAFLRRTKLDELPQLWNVLKGDMSLVGPRPCLPSQVDVINERDRFNIYNFRPGITGLAQIYGVDMSTPKLLAKMDAKMVLNLNLYSYLGYILKTLL